MPECPVCGEEVTPKTGSGGNWERIYCSTKCRADAYYASKGRAALRLYAQSPEGRKAQARYRKSPTGKEYLKAYAKAYANTPARMAYRKKYKQSPNGKSNAIAEARFAADHSGAISDLYVRKLLANSTSLQAKDIPQELVDLKRVHIQIHRRLKDGKEHYRSTRRTV